MKSYFKEKIGGGPNDPSFAGNSAIYESSLQCLEGDTYLNDTTVQFAIQLAYDQLSDDMKNKIHLFPFDFYTCLKQKRFESIKTQVQKSNFMTKDIIISLVCTGTHFMLVLIINPGACLERGSKGPILMILDSGQRFRLYFSVARDYQRLLPRYEFIICYSVTIFVFE